LTDCETEDYYDISEAEGTITFLDTCEVPFDLSVEAASDTDSDYSQPAVFTMPAVTVLPIVCPLTFTCEYVGGPNAGGEDACTYNDWTGTDPIDDPSIDHGKVTSTRFDTTTGDFTFFTRDKERWPPGTYSFKITVTVGDRSEIVEFDMILHEPCDDSTLSIATDYFASNQPFVYILTETDLEISYDPDSLVSSTTFVHCGDPVVTFTTFDNMVLPDVFSLDETNQSEFKLIVPSTSNLSTAGDYNLKWTFYYSQQPTNSITSPTFLV